jgi:hypothetical protein
MDEAADALRVSRRWLQDNLAGVPYLAAGRKKLFDDVAFNALKEKLRRCPSHSSSPRLVARNSIASGGTRPVSALTEARELLIAARRKGSSTSGAKKLAA